ncbi:MAG: hypothetical protein COU85_00385 [Candidatus Portnoybacteria bacterium CG10_big_fil_rev_8_21_14_0_10_44_7]|uniref:Glycosyltransferase 2-like domain-containing protein n=1 Tax=Candidatus Portnoybacteria bacterium CG10_big_fil_rev_8_21_14_0_10_44_7 TaxID=1974816 RepID=A0A2M8KJF8_9BACT|nr:MAG: hypothetical protein COU85_00385 [Candidatus Portnoybacteria bacterium CG10_big_fil_rev_8_21_14_0_10_44_7]
MQDSKKISALVSCFNGSKYLSEFLENCAQQTISNKTEIVLVHNEPSKEELETVKSFQKQYPGLINHIVVPKEPWDVSVNRAIKASQGKYVCIWNVDDLRVPDSLERMAETLDANPKVGFTYGDYIIVRKWQSQTGRLVVALEFEKNKFRQGMYLGPFFMWRKSLCGSIGLWDEQLRTGGDFDFAVRLAIVAEGKKTLGNLGFYLDEGLGLSTGRTPWQAIERTVIELRYGVYHKLDFWYYNRAKKYRILKILNGGVWYPLAKFVPSYKSFAENCFYILYAVFRYPFWLLRRVLNKINKSF